MITLKTRFLILACCISTLPLLAIIQAHACSTFLLQSDNCLIVGHNLDEDHDVPGHMILNKRRILKSNISWNEVLRGENEGDKRVQWISKFGSVTFNPGGGREFPGGGMNEAGLVVCEMSLGNTKYPQDTSRPKMFQMQWIQYLLDNFNSVEEVQKHIDEFELIGMNWHFFVADRKGNKMIVEFLDKQAMVYSNTDIIHPVLCNSTYSSELVHIRSFEGFGGETAIDLSSKEDKTDLYPQLT